MGGAVHLSKDYIIINDVQSFGQAVEFSDNSIRSINGAYISAVSQEHGTITSTDSSLFDHSTVMICPIHSCLTANLHDHYLTTTGNVIEKRILS